MVHSNMLRTMRSMYMTGWVSRSASHFVKVRGLYVICIFTRFVRPAGAATHGTCQLRLIANEEFMIIAIAIRASGDALEAPAIHLPHEARILALVGKILGGDLFTEQSRLEHSPRPPVRHPCDDVRIFRIREDFEQLCWKGGAGRWPSSTTCGGSRCIT